MFTWVASQTNQPACVSSLSIVSLASFSGSGANAPPPCEFLMLQGFSKNSNYLTDTSWETYGAQGRTRTGTEVALQRILSPLRLPIPPPGLRFECRGRDDEVKGRKWRLGSDSNRRTRLCRPLHNHSATQP